MPVSQFTIYTSSDPQGPGLVSGTTGSLIKILDACLVDGYGTGSYYKAAAGWTKPITNLSISGSPFSASQVACYKQPSGSQFTLFVNDCAPNIAAGCREAWVCGYEQITGLTSSLYPAGTVYSASNGNGAGNSQFPLPYQQLTYGHVVWRKSATVDTTGRPWIIAADAYTMYFWIQVGDSAGVWNHGAFGDCYSFAGANDLWNCIIIGRAVENSTGGPANSWESVIAGGAGIQNSGVTCPQTLGTAQPGCWIARGTGGITMSTGFVKKGDPQAGNGFGAVTPPGAFMCGYLQMCNLADNSIYLQPLHVVDPSSISLRGRLRGLYHPCHPIAAFSDGQKIEGGGDYWGKTFVAIKPDVTTAGMWFLETSNTVEAN